MSTNNNSNSGSIGLSGLLAIVFIVLKLIGKIDWSWWWVLAPIWFPGAMLLIGFLIYCIVREIRIKKLRR